MKKNLERARANPLFEGIALNDFEGLLHCLSAKTTLYKKGGVIRSSGDTVHFVGLVLSGSVKIIKEDADGNAAILAELHAPDMFGEVFACAGLTESPVTVQAADDAEILSIRFDRLITPCSSACHFHARLIKNMVGLLARKLLLLNQKIEILSKRTTKEKLLCFFDFQRSAAKKFAIPFNREELANYLCVDRSAMSSALCKMRDEGLIRFNKNTFEVLY
ncbi:MAG: Crp/Fnr family transcriptional regulator [Firmicutes bacterium]|nr:Crp/Fnr family transcriptional regulator [Bacillota bacterium]